MWNGLPPNPNMGGSFFVFLAFCVGYFFEWILNDPKEGSLCLLLQE